jgi:hypothetical protein
MDSDGSNLPINSVQQQWGLFLDGAPAVTADNVVSFEYKQDWNIADYQIEKGGFESYDKVQTPFDVRLRFSAGGSESNREALITSAQAVAGTMNQPNLSLFDAVTPEATYKSVNVRHIDYHRTATNGVGLVTVDLWLQEVRVNATPQFTSATPITDPKSPSSQSAVNGGNVQPTVPTSAQQQSIRDGLAAP